ncbi:MAG: hypothetical protein LC792_00015 [Actinobacteria bacterium]|nr:hypothetical protein [Actinomycetota bacterium]
MLHVSVETMWRLSGKQFGLCPVTVRPCRDKCADPIRTEWVRGQLRPVLDGGVWYNDPCQKCTNGCSCVELSEVTLPGPVESIVEITIDGQVLGAANYRVDDHRRLVAQGDLQWPTCQDLTVPLGQVGSFGVTYQRGLPVPAGGLWAAGLLACQLVMACSGSSECSLPANARQIAREGVTLDLAPVLVDGSGFRTGVPEADFWLNSVNPYRATGPSRVYSVDRPRPRTTTWPCT